MMKRISGIASLLVTLLLTSACIHKTGGAAVTPWERVTTYNASLAAANDAVEQGAEAVVTSGLATPAQIGPVIAANGRVASLQMQVTAILQQGAVTQVQLLSVKLLIDQIKSALAAVPPATLGFKNPKTQQTFSADLTELGTLADATLTSLEAVQP